MRVIVFSLLLTVCATGQVKTSPLDSQEPATQFPNTVRDATPQANAPLGTLSIRRTFTNTSNCPSVSLLFQVVSWTRGTESGQADLELLYAEPFSVQLSNGSIVTVYSARQVEDGWLGTGLMQVAPGARAHVQFLFAVMRGGAYNFNIKPFVEIGLESGTVNGQRAYLMPGCYK